MKEETPKCKDCGQPMVLVDAIGRTVQMGELDEKGFWRQTGRREMGLYQCPEDKTIAIF